jgi:hypothetical protein
MDQVGRKLGLFVLLAALVWVSGCGESGVAPTVKATGIVTYKGQGLSGVNVTFTPDKGRSATGTTDPAGKFTLSTFKTGDGAVEGTHKVAITPSGTEPMPGTPEAAKAGAAKPEFPTKYRDPSQSGLTATVKKGAENNFKLELTD